MSVCVFVLFTCSFRLHLACGYYAFLDWKLICNCSSSYFAVSTIVHINSFRVVRQLSCGFFSYTPHMQLLFITQTFSYVQNTDLCSFRLNTIVRKITVSNIKILQFLNCASHCNIQQWKPREPEVAEDCRHIPPHYITPTHVTVTLYLLLHKHVLFPLTYLLCLHIL